MKDIIIDKLMSKLNEVDEDSYITFILTYFNLYKNMTEEEKNTKNAFSYLLEENSISQLFTLLKDSSYFRIPDTEDRIVLFLDFLLTQNLKVMKDFEEISLRLYTDIENNYDCYFKNKAEYYSFFFNKYSEEEKKECINIIINEMKENKTTILSGLHSLIKINTNVDIINNLLNDDFINLLSIQLHYNNSPNIYIFNKRLDIIKFIYTHKKDVIEKMLSLNSRLNIFLSAFENHYDYSDQELLEYQEKNYYQIDIKYGIEKAINIQNSTKVMTYLYQRLNYICSNSNIMEVVNYLSHINIRNINNYYNITKHRVDNAMIKFAALYILKTHEELPELKDISVNIIHKKNEKFDNYIKEYIALKEESLLRKNIDNNSFKIVKKL